MRPVTRARFGVVIEVADGETATIGRPVVENASVAAEVVRLPGRTPVLYFDVASSGAPGTILLYGHLDKQPEMVGWRDGFGPWTPVLREGKLYGRGGADDGYAVFAAIAALRALQSGNRPHARAVILIETCEESGSYDLLPYVDALRARLEPDQLPAIGADS